jgi:CRP-like cAMP-binding protein
MELTLDSALSPGAFPGHASYFLVVLAMLMSSILALRLLALASGVAGLIYSALILADPVGVFWEIAFITANAAQLTLMAWRSRTVHFSDEEHAFHQTAIPLVPAALARRLIDAGVWRDLDAGTALTRQSETVDTLTYIADGTVDIRVDGQPVAACRCGDFVGELGIFSDHPATATAVAATPLRVLAFERQALMRAQRRDPDLRLALDAAFNANLRHKLTTANKMTIDRPNPA